MDLEHKTMPLASAMAEDVSDQWKFTGYAAVYGTVDRVNDIVRPGAFNATLAGKQSMPLLWQHQPDKIIGEATKLDAKDKKGLAGEFDLFDFTSHGPEAYKLIKRSRALLGMSIGYKPTEVDFDPDGHRLLKGVDLVEISLVTVPANLDAVVTGVKSMPLADRAELIREYLDSLATDLEGLADKGRTLTEAKRAEITALLEMFPSLDAVRPRLEIALAEPPTEAAPVWNARLEFTRRRLKAAGLLE